MNRTRMAVVGVGHLGKEHARVLASFPDVDLVGVADVDEAQAQAVADRCGTQAFESHKDLFDLVDAVIVAAPTLYHHAIARSFLKRGIPILVEKPITTTLAQAEELVEIAQGQGVPSGQSHRAVQPPFGDHPATTHAEADQAERHSPLRTIDRHRRARLMILTSISSSLVRSPCEVYALGRKCLAVTRTS